MRRVIIVQARMGSTRLPGKVLAELAGRPMLAQQLARLRRCRSVDHILVATSVAATDDAIAAFCRSEGIDCFRGSEQDVLARYVGAMEACAADLVVRVTADCPLIDATETDRVIDHLAGRAGEIEYASNVIRRTLPRGLDTEALFADVLRRVDRLARSAPAREHVTYFITTERPDLFRCGSVEHPEDNSDLRWTVDEAADLGLVRRLYADLDLAASPKPFLDVVRYQRAHPELVLMNAVVRQKAI